MRCRIEAASHGLTATLYSLLQNFLSCIICVTQCVERLSLYCFYFIDVMPLRYPSLH